MKRLLKVSLDSFIFSFIPIISWFILGLLVDKSLTNVFTLTYPIQFIWSMMKSIFGVGPNIYKEKHKDQNVVMSSIILGIIVGFFVFAFLALNIDSYIEFMNMDVSIYHNFALYSVIQLYIHMIFCLVLEKIYFEDKNSLANFYTLSFNLLNLIVLVITSLIFKNQFYIILITLLSIFIYAIFILLKEANKFRFHVNLLKFIQYDAVDICSSIFFFIIYFFGISGVAGFGENYIMAMNFAALLTDTQWDTFTSISTVAKIDISRGNFNYIEHRKNAYKLLSILFSTILILFVILFPFYQLDLILVLLYLSFEIVNFILEPVYELKVCFLQLEYSASRITSNNFIANILRTILSFLKTPFCTGIGQIVSMWYQFFTVNFLFYKHYKINTDGYIIRVDSK